MTIEDEIFDDMEIRYKQANYYKGDMLTEMAFLFYYVHVLRGDIDIRKLPKIKEALKEPEREVVEVVTPENVKNVLKKDRR